ncbi:hypothetical protein Pfo_013927 [Paulownia fortunei]|nr:hypothetical protein Pfo_013927 [Paulownia fortunei]
MESLVLQPLLQVVFEKLATLVLGNLNSLVNTKRDIKRLQDQLLLIQGVIQDAEERQVREENVKYWLNKLQSIAYDADDLLDKLHTNALRRQTNKKVPFLALFPTSYSLNSSLKLKDILNSIGDLASEISLYKLRNDVRYRRYESSERPQTGISVNESQVFGRGEDVQVIVKILLPSPSDPSGSSNSASRSTVPVLPIVGMGGIGKTTLGQLVYNNPEVQKHFNLKIWIAVGENFNVRKMIRDILEYTGEKDTSGSQLPQLGILQSRLQESLSSRKFLLMLDDVWNEDEVEWSKLREPLSYGISGSKIVVTTRSQAVAMLMGTYPSSYALKPLADDACWTLFQQFAFPNGGGEAYPILNDIGRNIVKKCSGIPLAAKVLGSLLRAHRDEREWLNVLRSEIWDLRDSSILSALKFSYNHLPPHQKRCFLYCSVFPKNYEINREKLIHQWIAEGLIPPPGDGTSHKEMEDIGNEYFNDLVWMSLFEGVSISKDGRIAEFKVHSLIHDLALSVSKPVSEKRDSIQEELFICQAERRALIVCNELSPATCNRLSIEKLRILQLICQGNDITTSISSLFKCLRHLRVLNLSNCGITILHKSVGGLIYLRYLDLSYNLMRRLPETICHLLNLQTLNLSSCHVLEELPRKISNLINLRHLNIEDCVRLSRMPANIGKLRNLQTLPIFIPGLALEESLYQLVHLELRGELNIKRLENVRNYVPESCLEYKQLQSLELSWGDVDEGKVGRNTSRRNTEWVHDYDVTHVLNCLAPNRNLKVWKINGYSGNMFPQRMNKLMLPNLTKLVLVNCRRCETLPTLGQLQCLKVLEMQGMDEIVKIADDFYGEGKAKPFPCLTELILSDFPKLRTWDSSEAMEAFPCLQKLSIIICPMLISMPRFPLLQHLDMHTCNDRILSSASKLNSLSTLVIDVFPEPFSIPSALLSNNFHLKALKISSFPKISSLPASIGTLTSLQSLSICFCESLENLPGEMLTLTNLETLEIIECPGLISLPDESIHGLKSLRSLSIENCPNLNSLPLTLRNITALEHLTIMYCPNLVCLPDVVHEFQALRSLNIVNCTGLASLPGGLEQVSSLQNLEIRGCPKLQELPDWIGSLVSLRYLAISECENIKFLPEGLKRLQGLQHLTIRDSPDLEVRCRMGTGEDWHKISHIPFKYIGSSTSQ